MSNFKVSNRGLVAVLGATIVLAAAPALAEPSTDSGAQTRQGGVSNEGMDTNAPGGRSAVSGQPGAGPSSEKDTSRQTKTGGEPGGNPDKN